MSVATKDALASASEALKQDVVTLLTTYNTNHPNVAYESPEAAEKLVDALIPRIAGVMASLASLHCAAKADIAAREPFDIREFERSA
jgi:DNA-directed RNA polymerase alpha subunit